MVIGRSSSGYFLKDKFSHWLSRSVPSSHLVCFYENATYKTNSDNSKLDVDVESTCSSNEQSDSNDDSGFNWESKHKGQFCQWVNTHHQTSTPKKASANSISLQIIIVSSKELPLSSDESSTIDIGSEIVTDEISNPWGDMEVDNIPIEIVDNLNFSEDDEPKIMGTLKGAEILFWPLSDDEHVVAALKFNLVINSNSHPVSFHGIGNECPCPPVITQVAKGNAACLFNSFSLVW